MGRVYHERQPSQPWRRAKRPMNRDDLSRAVAASRWVRAGRRPLFVRSTVERLGAGLCFHLVVASRGMTRITEEDLAEVRMACNLPMAVEHHEVPYQRHLVARAEPCRACQVREYTLGMVPCPLHGDGS